MAGRMREVTVQLKLAEHGARRRIDVSRSHARPHGGDSGLLRLQDRLVEFPGSRRRTADVHSAGPVRTIACEYNTEVTDYESGARNAGVGRAPVRQGRTFAGGDDGRERHAVGALAARFVFHGASNVGFDGSGTNLPPGDAK